MRRIAREEVTVELTIRRCIGALVALLLATGCSLRSEPVTFRSGDARLSGSLILPHGEGPHPAIVLIHGDGPDVRDSYRFFADRFASRGIAALIYDKRGAGESGGAFPSSFDQLADDAVAAMRFLRSRPEIDRDRVALWGGSQGAWIALLAATRPDARPSLVIAKAGAGVTPADLARWKSLRRVANAGHSGDARRRAAEIMELQFHILRTGNGWEELERAVETSRDEKWFPLVAVMRHSRWRSSWMSYGKDIDFDPIATLARVDAPVLWILGELDPETPLRETVDALERLERNGRPITVRVHPGADHQIELPRTRRGRPNFAPGYPDEMIDWAVERLKPRE